MTGAVDATDIERVFRAESGRAVASLVRFFGDIDIAEEAVQEAFEIAYQAVAGVGPAAKPGGLDHHDCPQPWNRPAAARGIAQRPTQAGAAGAHARRARGGRSGGRRPTATDLHLLPPGARHRGAGGADAAIDRRFADARDRPRPVGVRTDDGATAGACEEQDPRRQHPVSRARAMPSYQTGCGRCSLWSTSSSTRATSPPLARRWFATTCATRPSA